MINFILSSSQFIQIEMIGMKKINGLKEVASLYKNYFFDLDGVLVLHLRLSGKASKPCLAHSRY